MGRLDIALKEDDSLRIALCRISISELSRFRRRISCKEEESIRAKDALRLLERRRGIWVLLFLGLAPLLAASIDPTIVIFMSETLPSTAFSSALLTPLILNPLFWTFYIVSIRINQAKISFKAEPEMSRL